MGELTGGGRRICVYLSSNLKKNVKKGMEGRDTGPRIHSDCRVEGISRKGRECSMI